MIEGDGPNYVASEQICILMGRPPSKEGHITPDATEDLKGGAFKPEYTGKMNFYLAAVDDMLKHRTDQSSIGLMLCRSKKEPVVECALRGTTTPMGTSEFTHLEKLPPEPKGRLPTVEEREAELGTEEEPVT